jgi:hypothetical protein
MAPSCATAATRRRLRTEPSALDASIWSLSVSMSVSNIRTACAYVLLYNAVLQTISDVHAVT